MPLTPKQTAIHELLVRRQEALMDIRVLHREYDRKLHALGGNPDARKTLNEEYAAEMRTREKIRDGIVSKLAGETPLADADARGRADWLPSAEPPPGDREDEPDPDDPDGPPYTGLNADGEPQGLAGSVPDDVGATDDAGPPDKPDGPDAAAAAVD